MEALNRLDAALETQMECIEKDSADVADHVDYWGAVRTEYSLKYVARKQNMNRLGLHQVPTAGISAAKAKEAIEMQLLCKSLLNSCWAKNNWRLQDVSWERYTTPPKHFIKKDPYIVEVMFDNDPANKAWYTLFRTCLSLTENGWFETTCEADEKGCFYMDADRQPVYYVWFQEDADKFGPHGVYEVLNPTSVSSSSVDIVNEVDGQPPEDSCVRHTGSATGDLGGGPAEPYGGRPGHSQGSGGSEFDPATGVSSSFTVSRRSNCSKRKRSQSPHRGARDPICIPPRPSSKEAVSVPLERVQKGPTQANADSSSASPSVTVAGAPVPCLLLSGTVNNVKCLRWRIKKSHGKKFCNISTTYQYCGEGSARVGSAMVQVTFQTFRQREVFMSLVTIPSAVKATRMTLWHED